MTANSLIDLALGLAIVVYLCTRQLTWRAVDPARMWRMPLILGVIGVVLIAQTAHTSITATDVVLLGLSAVLAIASGLAMGSIARFRPISEANRAAAISGRRSRDAGGPAPTVESRTGWVGVLLWVLLIALRVGLDVYGQHHGAKLATSAGVIFLMIALNRAGRTALLSARLGHRSPSMA